MPVIGFLNTRAPEQDAHLLAAFRQGLTENGYVEHRNVAIEYRWAEGHNARLPALAADLVRRQVTVIAANSQATVAAKAATTTIPIVFITGADPVQVGFIASLKPTWRKPHRRDFLGPTSRSNTSTAFRGSPLRNCALNCWRRGRS
jgi:putative ABC transport system substrate-binding protein